MAFSVVVHVLYYFALTGGSSFKKQVKFVTVLDVQ